LFKLFILGGSFPSFIISLGLLLRSLLLFPLSCLPFLPPFFSPSSLSACSRPSRPFDETLDVLAAQTEDDPVVMFNDVIALGSVSMLGLKIG